MEALQFVQIVHVEDAQEFILRATEYLAGVENTDLNIMARQAVRPSLRAGSTLTAQIVIFLLPAAVLLAALLVLIERNRKR